MRGGSRGGEDNYGRSLALVGGQHCADGSRGCVVKACRLLLTLLHKKLINFRQNPDAFLKYIIMMRTSQEFGQKMPK